MRFRLLPVLCLGLIIVPFLTAYGINYGYVQSGREWWYNSQHDWQTPLFPKIGDCAYHTLEGTCVRYLECDKQNRFLKTCEHMLPGSHINGSTWQENRDFIEEYHLYQNFQISHYCMRIFLIFLCVLFIFECICRFSVLDAEEDPHEEVDLEMSKEPPLK